jgi:hypothetical protein
VTYFLDYLCCAAGKIMGEMKFCPVAKPCFCNEKREFQVKRQGDEKGQTTKQC